MEGQSGATKIPKLVGNENWTVWKKQVVARLQYLDFEEVLDGGISVPDALPKTPPPSKDDKDAYERDKKLYKKANGYAMDLLLGSVGDEPRTLIATMETAKEMWDKLISTYENQSEQRLESLWTQLFEYRYKSGDSIATHVSKLDKIWRELQEETFRVDGMRFPDTVLMVRVISSLPTEFKSFATTWESVPRAERTLKYLEERLKMVEGRLLKEKANKVAGNSVFAAASRFPKEKEKETLSSKGAEKSSASKPAPKPPTAASKKDYSSFKCHVCGKLGHIKYKCPKLSKTALSVSENHETASESSVKSSDASDS